MRFFLAILAAGLGMAADWHGFEKREFTVDGVAGYVVLPRVAAPGKPWLWRARFPEFNFQAAEGLSIFSSKDEPKGMRW
jgi:hypothetical protein